MQRNDLMIANVFDSRPFHKMADRMRIKIHRAFLFATVACCVLSAGTQIGYGQSAASRSTAPSSKPQRLYDGFTRPSRTVLISAEEMGRIAKVNVEIGQRVESGEVVAELEDGLQQVALEIAAMQLKMEGEREGAAAELELVKRRTEQLVQLSKDGMARPDELKRSQTDLRVATARVKSLDEQLQLRKVELQRAKVMLQRRKIQSPFTGVISQVILQPGEYMSLSSPAIAEMLVVDEIKAVFDVPVQDVTNLKIGSVASVRMASSSETVEAPITAISPMIDDRSGTVQIQATIDNRDGKWRVGDRCFVQLLSRKPDPSRTPGAKSTTAKSTTATSSTATSAGGRISNRKTATGAPERK